MARRYLRDNLEYTLTIMIATKIAQKVRNHVSNFVWGAHVLIMLL